MSKPTIDVDGLVHIAIVVKDVRRAAAEWARLLGVDEPPVVARGNDLGKEGFQRDPRNRYRDDHNYTNGPEYEWLEADFQMKGFVLELVQPEQGTGPYKEYFEKHGTGIHHIAFRNDRCDEFNDMLEAEGYPYIVETYSVASGDRWPVHDTEDVLGTNLCIKPPKESLHPKG
jgi:hypothetical protein